MRKLAHALLAWPMFFFASQLVADEQTFYEPIEKQIEGWTIKVDPQLLAKENEEVATKAFTALANHLQRVKYILLRTAASNYRNYRFGSSSRAIGQHAVSSRPRLADCEQA